MPFTLQQEFQEWLKACYPDPPKATAENCLERDQYFQLEEAFFAGALVAHTNQADMVPQLRAYSEMVKSRALGRR